MKNLIVMILLSFLMGACDEQKSQSQIAGQQFSSTDTLVKPKVDIKVNRKYDDQGNLVQYDSTYSYYYSSPGFKNNINSDSLINAFKSPLQFGYKGLQDDNMNSIFFNDSLFKYDFYNNDYFSKRFQLNMRGFEDMFRKMDSLKMSMLKNTYPGGEIRKRSK